MGLDRALFGLVNRGTANPLYDATLPWLTDGRHNTALLVLVGLVILLLARLRHDPEAMRTAWRVVLVAVAAVGLGELIGSHLLKHWVARPRPPLSLPDVRLLVPLGPSFSFPSAHAVNTMAVMTAVSLGYPRWSWPALGYAAVIVYSRVYVGVHWPTDVFGGLLLGALLAAALWRATAGRSTA